MYTISKEFEFSASHQLTGLHPDHPCMRLHGHNYKVRIVVGADKLDHRSFVLDYAELAPFKKYIDTYIDQRNLNDVLGTVQTSAENLASFLYRQAESLLPSAWIICVGVSETTKTWAYYFPETSLPLLVATYD